MGKSKAKKSKSGPLQESGDGTQDIDSGVAAVTSSIELQGVNEVEASRSSAITKQIQKSQITEEPGKKHVELIDNIDWIELQSTESKGMAVFALRKIKPGTLILRETPLIRLTQAEEDEDKDATNINKPSSLVEDHFNRLPRAAQKAHLKLCDSEKAGFSRVKSIYYSNCYNLSGANRPSKYSPGGSVIGSTASRINHSCLPNVQFSFDEDTNEMLFHAIKPIPKGREIVSNYNPVLEVRAARQRKQMLYYGFRCDCEACDAKTEFWAKSDERRKAMIEARRHVKSCDKMFELQGRVSVDGDPMSALERLETLYLKEGISGLPLADVYRSLGKWAERKGDRKAARSWKTKELGICKISFGERSPRVKLVEGKIEALS